MAYATLDDVQRRMPQFQLTATSKPSTEPAQVFLDDTHAQFDSAMENLGYVVPITGERALAQCKEIVCQGTIAKILYARAAAVGTDVAVHSADRAQRQYDDSLKNLANEASPIDLKDAVRTSDEQAKTGVGPMGLTVDDNGDAITARATMDQNF